MCIYLCTHMSVCHHGNVYVLYWMWRKWTGLLYMCHLWVACEKCIKSVEGPAGVRKAWGCKIDRGGRRNEGGGSKGHSCRGLMPRVEELELEPRNVPQRPLKREVKREGVQGKTRARASDVSCTAQSLRIYVRVEGGEWYFILVSLIHHLNLPPPPPPLLLPHPLLLRHFGNDQPQFTRLLFSMPLLPACFMCHILCLVSVVIYGWTQEAVCVWNCTVMVKCEERGIYQTSRGCH